VLGRRPAGGPRGAAPSPASRSLRPWAVPVALLGALAAWTAHFGATYLLLTLGCAGTVPGAAVWTSLATLLAGGAAAGTALLARRWLGYPDLDAAERFALRTGAAASLLVVVVLVLEGLALLTVSWCVR
jgi:hypothetical protein